MRGRTITLAGYLYADLDKRRAVEEGEKESWSQFFARTFNIKYRPHGVKRTPGRPRKVN